MAEEEPMSEATGAAAAEGAINATAAGRARVVVRARTNARRRRPHGTSDPSTSARAVTMGAGRAVATSRSATRGAEERRASREPNRPSPKTVGGPRFDRAMLTNPGVKTRVVLDTGS